MAINQASKPITIFDDSSNTHLYHIRSPEVPEIVVKNLDSSTSGSEGRNSLQKSRFNIYKSENGSPFIISDMNDNKILRSLGVSKLSSVPRTRKSNSETSEQIIISGEESEIEVESNQNSRNSRRRTKQRSHYDNTSISKMEQIQKRLDRQEEILETIARKLNQSDSADGRNVRSSESVRSNRSTQSTSNFTVPGLATDKNKQGTSQNFMEHVQSMSNISTDASNLERLNRWASAIRMFKDRPVFGFGPGTYQFEYAPYQSSEEKTLISTNAGDRGNAHSEYIGPLSEEGLLGTILVICVFIYSIVVAMRVYRRSDDKDVKMLTLATMLGLLTYYFHGLMNNFLDSDKASVPVWGYIAILVAFDLYYLPAREKEE